MKTWCLMLTAALFVAGGCSTVQPKSAGSFERGARIASKISEAERLGAKECSPRQLAKVRVALERVMHEAREGYYTDAWLEPDFADADRLADELLAERRLADSLGRQFRCVSASGGSRGGSWRRGPADLIPGREERLLPWPAGDDLGSSGDARSQAFPPLHTATD